ncbi:hypothetical protein RI367_002108 [Sorochytrium milnesiophthora]
MNCTTRTTDTTNNNAPDVVSLTIDSLLGYTGTDIFDYLFAAYDRPAAAVAVSNYNSYDTDLLAQRMTLDGNIAAVSGTMVTFPDVGALDLSAAIQLLATPSVAALTPLPMSSAAPSLNNNNTATPTSTTNDAFASFDWESLALSDIAMPKDYIFDNAFMTGQDLAPFPAVLPSALDACTPPRPPSLSSGELLSSFDAHSRARASAFADSAALFTDAFPALDAVPPLEEPAHFYTPARVLADVEPAVAARHGSRSRTIDTSALTVVSPAATVAQAAAMLTPASPAISTFARPSSASSSVASPSPSPEPESSLMDAADPTYSPTAAAASSAHKPNASSAAAAAAPRRQRRTRRRPANEPPVAEVLHGNTVIPTTTKKSSTKVASIPEQLVYPSNLIPHDAPIHRRAKKRSALESGFDDADGYHHHHHHHHADMTVLEEETIVDPTHIKLEDLDEHEAKRIRNTLSARRSRARKAAKIDFLEDRVNELETENDKLQREVLKLRRQLESVNQQRNTAAADVVVGDDDNDNSDDDASSGSE